MISTEEEATNSVTLSDSALAPRRVEIAFRLQDGDHRVAVADLHHRCEMRRAVERHRLYPRIAAEEEQRLRAVQLRRQVLAHQVGMQAACADHPAAGVGDDQEAAVIGRFLGQGAEQELLILRAGRRRKAGFPRGFDRRLGRAGDQRQVELAVMGGFGAIRHQRHGAGEEHHAEEDHDQNRDRPLQDRFDAFELGIGGAGQETGVARHGSRRGIFHPRNRQYSSPRRTRRPFRPRKKAAQQAFVLKHDPDTALPNHP